MSRSGRAHSGAKEDAAHWLVAHGREMSGDETSRFQEWLASPAHEQEWARAQLIWQSFSHQPPWAIARLRAEALAYRPLRLVVSDRLSVMLVAAITSLAALGLDFRNHH